MMKKIILALSLVSFCFFFSCTEPTPQEKEKELIEKINLLHDVETMPKMGRMQTLKKTLSQLENVKAPKKVWELKKNLSDADDAMMDWMAQFNWQSEHTPIDNRIAYYEKEVEKLEAMKKLMYDAIEEAEINLGLNQE